MWDKIKEVVSGVYKSKAVRVAFKAFLVAVAVAGAGVLGLELAPETVEGLLN
jgi:NADH dehydrogenase FAD-containing subunit